MKFLDLGDDSASTLVSVSAKKKKNLSSELDLVEAQARAEAERSRLPRQTIIFRKLRPGQPEQTTAIAKNSKNLVSRKIFGISVSDSGFQKHLNNKNDRRSFSAMTFSIVDISIFRRQSNERFTSLYYYQLVNTSLF